MARVTVRYEDGNGALAVGDRTLAPGQATTLTLAGTDSLTVQEREPEVRQTAEETRDVFSPGNRPNGLVTAEIAPKLPKSGGETRQEPIAPGHVAELPVAELGVATRGGGPEAEGVFQTPGPKPELSTATAAADRTGTGDVDEGGKPLPAGKAEEGKPAPKAQAKK